MNKTQKQKETLKRFLTFVEDVFPHYEICDDGDGGEIEDKMKRVFSSNKMKAYDSEDVLMSTIKERGKDIKIKDSYGGTYLVNKVILENGKKGYVWSDNQKFEK